MHGLTSKFWEEVVIGYERVARNSELIIEIERDNKHAMIQALAGSAGIVISIWDNPSIEPPTLVVPPGQGGKED